MNKEKSDQYRFLFVGDIPILCHKRRLGKQIQVELFLDNTPLKKIGLKFREDYDKEKTRRYIC